jgi:uncharacterized membrane protein YjjP (DUF1212 family)
MSEKKKSERPATRESQGGGRAELVLEIGRALLRLGAPAYRLEDTMQLLSHRLGLEGQFYCTPTAFVAAIGRGSDQRSVMARVDNAEINLGKLSRIHDIIESLSRGDMGPVQAIREVRATMEAERQYRWPTVSLAAALLSAAVAILFGGGPIELAVATGVGLMVGLLGSLMQPYQNLGRLFPPLAGLLAALFAGLSSLLLPEFSVYLAMVAGLIVLMPGLSITLATRELATGHLVAGSARMSGALVQLTIIGFGVALGSQISQLMTGPLPQTISGLLPFWAHWLGLLAAGIGFTVLFQSQPSKIGWITLAGVLAAEVGGRMAGAFNPGLGALIGALLVGILGNVYARRRNRPAVLIHVPGIMLLVPGSLGFSGIASLMAEDALGGVQVAFTVALVAAGLSTGLLLASVLVPPRRAL